MRRVMGVLVLTLLAGCSGSSNDSSEKVPPDASVCALALDKADQGFTEFAAAIRQVKEAFDVGTSGNPRRGTELLSQVHLPSPDRYKQLEQECRDAVSP